MIRRVVLELLDGRVGVDVESLKDTSRKSVAENYGYILYFNIQLYETNV